MVNVLHEHQLKRLIVIKHHETRHLEALHEGSKVYLRSSDSSGRTGESGARIRNEGQPGLDFK